jgi:protein SCO1/2
MKSLIVIVLGLSLVPFLASGGDEHAHHHHHHSGGDSEMNRNRPPALEGQSIYNLSDKWTAQDGRESKLTSLSGRPVVIAMLYTSCQTACPMTVTDLKRIEASLPPETLAKVRFAVFSFDPKRDTTAKLAEFAKTRSLDTSRWTLYHGSKAAVRKLAAVLGIQYKQDSAGEFDHSNVITLVDSGGVIRKQKVGLGGEPEEMVEAITSLAPAPAPSAGPAAGSNAS